MAEHKVIISDHISVNLDIPVEISVSELYGLMKQVNKLASVETYEMQGKNSQKKILTWTKEDIQTLIDNWDGRKKTSENIQAIHKAFKGNMDKGRISSKVYDLLRKEEIKSKRRGR